MKHGQQIKLIHLEPGIGYYKNHLSQTTKRTYHSNRTANVLDLHASICTN